MYRSLTLTSLSAFVIPPPSSRLFFFFNDTATTEIYTLSLHDALPICPIGLDHDRVLAGVHPVLGRLRVVEDLELGRRDRSEEHTSELQSQFHLVCRLLPEKTNSPRTMDLLDHRNSMSSPRICIPLARP